MSKRAERRREIERLFALREREGLSLRELAERFGIPVGTLSWWSHRLREKSTPAFCEVRVSHEGAANTAVDMNNGYAALRLHLPGGAVAEFAGDLAERVARTIVEDLVRC